MEKTLVRKTIHHPRESPANATGRIISLWLDTYDDIFSDFDPRPFAGRNFSDDFLNEVEKVSRESELPVTELRLLLPEKERNAEIENVIIKRLHSHFKSGLISHDASFRSTRQKGILLLMLGMLLMLGAGFISTLGTGKFSYRILFVFSEPAGWYFAWTGFEKLFAVSRHEMPGLQFYRKMNKSRITFLTI